MGRGEILASIRSAAHRLGIELRLFDRLRDIPEARIAALCEAESIDVLVDVGANDGVWAHAVRRAGYDGQIISIEPHPYAFARLLKRVDSDPRWEARPIAIAETSGRMTLHMTGSSVWSSVLPAAQAGFGPTRPIEQRVVMTSRLDTEVVAGERIFLKLDVQGYELSALRSASGIVDRVRAGKVEVLLEDIYRGQPSLLDVLGELDRSGFVIIGFEHGHMEHSGKERFIDILFTRNPAT